MVKENYPAVSGFFRDGYGAPLCTVLLRSMERYIDTDNPRPDDQNGMWLLSSLLKCVMRDEFGVDLDSTK